MAYHWIPALLFLLLVPDTQPKWNPSITAVVDMSNLSLIVSVRPVIPPIAYLKVCISKSTIVINCHGRVVRIENPKETLRYSVADLATNQSYSISVRPFNEKGKPLDIWIVKKDPVFIPLPEAPVKPLAETGVALWLVLVLVIAIVIMVTAVSVYCLRRKGYLQEIWLSKWCLPQPSIKVLQVYGESSQPFLRLVKTHKEYLAKYLNLECRDLEQVRLNPEHRNLEQMKTAVLDVNALLEQADTVLVYLSPRLMELLTASEDFFKRNPQLMVDWTVVNHVHKTATAMAAHRGCRRRQSPIIFIVPDCWSTRLGAQLDRADIYKHLPRFPVLRSAPGPLLSQLSGRRQCGLSPCWGRSAQDVTGLRSTLDSLLKTIKTGEEQNRKRELNNGHAGGDAGEEGGTPNGFAYNKGENHQKGPLRTDSGFSSVAPDQRGGKGSNSSEEGVPGETCPMMLGMESREEVS